MFWIIVCVKFCWKSASMVTEIFAKQHRDHFYGTPCKISEAFANLKRVLKLSCLNASEDIMREPIMSLPAIVAAQ